LHHDTPSQVNFFVSKQATKEERRNNNNNNNNNHGEDFVFGYCQMWQ
jgi:hypothetical protein